MTTIQRVDAKMKGFAQRQAEREQQRRARQREKRRLYSNALPRHIRSAYLIARARLAEAREGATA
jgi:hypothetical protein